MKCVCGRKDAPVFALDLRASSRRGNHPDLALRATATDAQTVATEGEAGIDTSVVFCKLAVPSDQNGFDGFGLRSLADGVDQGIDGGSGDLALLLEAVLVFGRDSELFCSSAKRSVKRCHEVDLA